MHRDCLHHRIYYLNPAVRWRFHGQGGTNTLSAGDWGRGWGSPPPRHPRSSILLLEVPTNEASHREPWQRLGARGQGRHHVIKSLSVLFRSFRELLFIYVLLHDIFFLSILLYSIILLNYLAVEITIYR